MPFEYFVKEVNESIQEFLDWNDYKVGYFLSRSKIKKTANEDVVFLKGEGNSLLFGVSDGAGGHPRGKDAAAICGKKMIDIKPSVLNEKLNVISYIEEANDEVTALKVGAHATLTVGMLCDEYLKCFSVGDSELVYWNRNGTEVYSTIPHSEVGYKIEAGVINQEDSLDEEDRYIVNNLIGDPTIRIESTSKMLTKKGHTILVGSDGLFDNLSHDKLKSILCSGNIEESFQTLCEICKVQDENDWKKDDDISFVVIKKMK